MKYRLMGAKKIIVFGASSYIGSFLCDFLEGKNEITRLSSENCNLLNLESVISFFKYLPDNKHSIIFLSVNRTESNRIEGFEKNMKMLRNFIKGIDLSKISSLVYLSTVKVYGSQPSLPISEGTALHPIDWYSLSKTNCEWILNHSLGKELPVTILRIPGIYGQSPIEQSIIGNFIKNIHQTKKVEVFGTGLMQRDYVYIKDLINIIEKIILIPELKRVKLLNIATGKSYSILEILDKIRCTLGVDFVIEYSTRNGGEGDLKFDISKFKKTFPLFEFSSLEKGISSYLN